LDAIKAKLSPGSSRQRSLRSNAGNKQFFELRANEQGVGSAVDVESDGGHDHEVADLSTFSRRGLLDFDKFADDVDNEYKTDDSSEESFGCKWDEDEDEDLDQCNSPIKRGVVSALPNFDVDSDLRLSAAALQSGLPRRAYEQQRKELNSYSCLLSTVGSSALTNTNSSLHPGLIPLFAHLSRRAYKKEQISRVMKLFSSETLKSSSKHRQSWQSEKTKHSTNDNETVLETLLQLLQGGIAADGNGSIVVSVERCPVSNDLLVTATPPLTSLSIAFSLLGQVSAALNQMFEYKNAMLSDSNSTVKILEIAIDALVTSHGLTPLDRDSGSSCDLEDTEVNVGPSTCKYTTEHNYQLDFNLDAERSLDNLLDGLRHGFAAFVGLASILFTVDEMGDWRSEQYESVLHALLQFANKNRKGNDEKELFSPQLTKAIHQEISHINDYTTGMVIYSKLNGLGIGTCSELGHHLNENRKHLESRGVSKDVSNALFLAQVICGDSDKQTGIGAVKIMSEAAQVRRGRFDGEGNILADYFNGAGTSELVDHAQGRLASKTTRNENDDADYQQAVDQCANYEGRLVVIYDNLNKSDSARGVDAVGKAKGTIDMTVAVAVRTKPGFERGVLSSTMQEPKVGVDHLLLSTAGDNPPQSPKTFFTRIKFIIRTG
jgi:hypothetical protein